MTAAPAVFLLEHLQRELTGAAETEALETLGRFGRHRIGQPVRAVRCSHGSQRLREAADPR